jgi:single-strand DNA-binding protein
MDLNRATLIGNVTRDPEARTTPTGQTVCNFGVATNQAWTDAQGQKQQRAEFHNIVAWGKLADICRQYLNKGKKIYVEGRLQTREWEAQDGQKKRTTEIVADNMIMLSGGPGGAPMGASSRPSMPQEPTLDPIASSPAAQALDKGVGDQEIRVEDIPF